MFQDPHDAVDLKEDFRNRFRNVSRLMDCVGCDKCRLWGKLQTVGYGTALKVLFEYEEDRNGENPPLRRTELVALVNTLDRVARSLTALGEMRALVEAKASASSAAPQASDLEVDTKSSPTEGFDYATPSAPSSDTHSSQNLDDGFDEDDYDDDDEPIDILTAFRDEWRLVFRTLGYVLRSWIDFPAKLVQIFALEASRVWNYWLGLPVQPRDYVWGSFGEGAPVRGGGEKGEL